MLRHTTPDARRQTPGTRDEHLQDSFLALTNSLMPEKVLNRGKEAKPIPGIPVVPNSGRKRAKWKTAPVPCARKRETDTEQTGKQRPGRNYLNLTFHRETTLIHAWAEKLRPAIPRGRNSPLEHNPFIILCRDSLKAAMRVGYCVLHSQVAFVVQDATCGEGRRQRSGPSNELLGNS